MATDMGEKHNEIEIGGVQKWGTTLAKSKTGWTDVEKSNEDTKYKQETWAVAQTKNRTWEREQPEWN